MKREIPPRGVRVLAAVESGIWNWQGQNLNSGHIIVEFREAGR